MSKVDLLKEALKNVKSITNDMEFSSNYGADEERFFATYKKELEAELAEEEGEDAD